MTDERDITEPLRGVAKFLADGDMPTLAKVCNDAREEIRSLTARLAAAEAAVKQLKHNEGNFRRLIRNMRRADEAAKGGRE